MVGPPAPVRGRRLAPGLRLFDPFALTAQRLHDSVDSIHFGKETNALIVQVMLAAHDNTPRVHAMTRLECPVRLESVLFLFDVCAVFLSRHLLDACCACSVVACTPSVLSSCVRCSCWACAALARRQ